MEKESFYVNLQKILKRSPVEAVCVCGGEGGEYIHIS